MQPSRRGYLGLCGVAGAVAVAGCTGALPDDLVSGDAVDGGAGESGPTESESGSEPAGDPVADDASLRVTLTVDETRTLFESRHVETVGPVETGQNGMPYLALRLTDEGVEAATETAVAADLGERYEDAEIAVIADGEKLNRFGVAQPLARSIVDGEWDGAFRMTFESEASAESFRETLVTGSG
ncbi:hypothetical protein CK500_10530 [Halorubrum salipaludis]|uniref:Uncharacterized protein n=1 Tax=Halorubrum salipaludis TaxID=2032630 RepID=A0A2A2FF52_9EURY|nr:hypothetical protein [Halorubrum salipaludis]PAU83229.1 hypothetical protein CK500_10530 [Halorubrum salipaludis]